MMLATVLDCILIAQRDRWERLGDRFSHQAEGASAAEMLSVIGPAAAIVLLLLIAHRWFSRVEWRINSNPRLFAELCRAHGIGFRGRLLLKRLARGRRLSPPALLFVTPDGFEPASLPEELRSRAQEIAQLRARLFHDLPSETPRTAQ